MENPPQNEKPADDRASPDADRSFSDASTAPQEAAHDAPLAPAQDEPTQDLPETETFQIETLVAERDSYKDRFMRALADAENMRKRAERDRREAERYGAARLARDMMPVYDNLCRALDSGQGEADNAMIEGIELTLKELRTVFEKNGISLISPQQGDPFDPQFHQAMFEASVPDTKAGQIIQVMSEGFMLYERLLRPAQVGVSSTVVPS